MSLPEVRAGSIGSAEGAKRHAQLEMATPVVVGWNLEDGYRKLGTGSMGTVQVAPLSLTELNQRWQHYLSHVMCELPTLPKQHD